MAIGAAALIAISLLGSAVVAEGALHPLITRRASDTAALAYSIAGTIYGTATNVTIRARDGTSLDAWWLTPLHSNGSAVVVCHGIADSAHGALGFALLFLKNGYDLLVPESRGHGKSRGFVTYGVLESDDILRWLTWIRSRGVNTVFGFGESLGGAILIQSLAKGARFRALVAKSSYSDFETSQTTASRRSFHDRLHMYL